MTDEIQWSEPRLHDGGECPVGPGDVVRVLYRGWRTNIMAVPASTWRWENNSKYPGSDIIAYQVQIKPPRKMIAPWHVLPPDYRWVAADKDEKAHAFRGCPTIYGNLLWIAPDNAPIRIDQLVGYEPGDLPWDQSLVERPDGV